MTAFISSKWKRRENPCDKMKEAFWFPSACPACCCSACEDGETVARRPTALEKPLTGCVSRTHCLVCFAEELSWKCGRYFSICLWTSISLNPVISNLWGTAVFIPSGFVQCKVMCTLSNFSFILIAGYIPSTAAAASQNRQEFTCSSHSFSFSLFSCVCTVCVLTCMCMHT